MQAASASKTSDRWSCLDKPGRIESDVEDEWQSGRGKGVLKVG
jgi:hypothetical protein